MGRNGRVGGCVYGTDQRPPKPFQQYDKYVGTGGGELCIGFGGCLPVAQSIENTGAIFF